MRHGTQVALCEDSGGVLHHQVQDEHGDGLHTEPLEDRRGEFAEDAAAVLALVRRHGGNDEVLGYPAVEVADWSPDRGVRMTVQVHSGGLAAGSAAREYLRLPADAGAGDLPEGVGTYRVV